MSTANFSRLLRWNVIRRADAEALVDGARRYSFTELDAEVDRTARGLQALGCQRGDVVAVLGRNSAEFVIALFAIARLGAVLLPLNTRLHERELEYILGNAGAQLLLLDAEFAPSAAALLTAGRLAVAAIHDAPDAPRRMTSLPAVLDGVTSDPVPDAAVGADDATRIMYTSGTTSHPKGVITSYGNVIANQHAQLLELELRPGDRMLASSPLFHVAALEAPGYHTICAGGALVIARSFGGRDLLELVERERVNGIVMPGAIALDLLRQPRPLQHDISSLRHAIFGAVTPMQRAQLMELMPHVRVIDTFGMTELTNGVIYMDRAHMHSKLGAAGTAVPYMEIAVHDPAGAPTEPGEVGEIVVRGPKCSPGYWRDQAATAAAWQSGWFHTGDLARLDADGYLWFVDRMKDVIKSGGENIASAEIERVLSAHDGVAEVAVIGIPDERWGQVPKAFVVGAGPATPDADALIEHCRANLARFKVPRYYEFVDSLPRNASGKVLKGVLRAQPQTQERNP